MANRDCTGVCVVCGSPLLPRVARKPDGRRYTYTPKICCSKACGSVVGAQARSAKAALRERPQWSRVWFRVCRICSAPFASSTGRVTTCTPCRVSKKERLRNEYAAGALQRRSAMQSTPCLVCRGPVGYTFGAPRKHCLACSDAARKAYRRQYKRTYRAVCGHATRHHEQRALKGGGHVVAFNKFDIFDRDGWRCQYCQVQTPKGSRGQPDSPELDHVVPLCDGGDHAPWNVRLLCRACNADKGAKDDWEWQQGISDSLEARHKAGTLWMTDEQWERRTTTPAKKSKAFS